MCSAIYVQGPKPFKLYFSLHYKFINLLVKKNTYQLLLSYHKENNY